MILGALPETISPSQATSFTLSQLIPIPFAGLAFTGLVMLLGEGARGQYWDEHESVINNIVKPAIAAAQARDYSDATAQFAYDNFLKGVLHAPKSSDAFIGLILGNALATKNWSRMNAFTRRVDDLVNDVSDEDRYYAALPANAPGDAVVFLKSEGQVTHNLTVDGNVWDTRSAFSPDSGDIAPGYERNSEDGTVYYTGTSDAARGESFGQGD